MSIWTKMIVAVMALTAATACGSSSPMSPTPTSVSATIVNGAFNPNSITISAGSTVTWMNNDTATHSVVADSGAFNSGAIAPGGSYSYAFPSAGTFSYHDSANANMKGVVNVTGSSSPY
ncbi:MAG TPA: cupredoxin domain-containing protein [Vicinamibacterales bacterium]|jgi:plastocyanin|nr:cupredoxin domain-containing protein [Vicinamibacterales bacterium]